MSARPTFMLTVRPSGLLTAAGAVGCVATLFGFLGRFSWFMDLFSHFRVQYLVGLGVLGLLCLLGRRRRTAVLLMAFASINLAVVLPMYFGDRATPPQDAHALRAMLLNVNTRHGDPVRVRQAIEQVNPDFVVLEEISSQWIRDLEPLTRSYPHSCVQPREDNFGIGLFSKLPLTQSNVVHIGEAEVPSILATLRTGSAQLRVVATHPLPPGGTAYSRWRNDQLDRLPDFTDAAMPVMLLGDLNVTPWNHYFRRLLRRTGLLDSSRGRGIQPSWPSFNPLLRIPIDHCLHSPDITVLDRRIGPDVGSDHYPVIVDFVIPATPDSNGETRVSTAL